MEHYKSFSTLQKLSDAVLGRVIENMDEGVYVYVFVREGAGREGKREAISVSVLRCLFFFFFCQDTFKLPILIPSSQDTSLGIRD